MFFLDSRKSFQKNTDVLVLKKERKKVDYGFGELMPDTNLLIQNIPSVHVPLSQWPAPGYGELSLCVVWPPQATVTVVLRRRHKSMGFVVFPASHCSARSTKTVSSSVARETLDDVTAELVFTLF